MSKEKWQECIVDSQKATNKWVEKQSPRPEDDGGLRQSPL